jgi:ABC-type dipeptide/oligopeptide/nickel transport system ATPase component
MAEPKRIISPDVVLTVEDVDVTYETEQPVNAVKHASFELHRGEMMGLAGESGCGKSTLAYSVNQLLKPPGYISSGKVTFHDFGGQDIDVRSLENEALRDYQWDKCSMVFQGAMNSLSPVTNIGKQLGDVFKTHRPDMKKKEREARCAHLLEIVDVDPNRLKAFPFELSGGMRQRVMIAMALALEPQVIIMDEPTTALDVVVQREIIDQIAHLQKTRGFSVIFITHDLPMLLEITDTICIMKDGVIVEHNTTEEIYRHPQDDYTKKLLSSFPSLTGARGSFRYGKDE